MYLHTSTYFIVNASVRRYLSRNIYYLGEGLQGGCEGRCEGQPAAYKVLNLSSASAGDCLDVDTESVDTGARLYFTNNRLGFMVDGILGSRSRG
jgi:hypothetical protein